MKTRPAVIAVVLLSLAFVPCAVGQQKEAQTGKSVGELLTQMNRVHPQRVRTNIIAVDWADPAFVIPAAGNVSGANNTHFRSDVTIINYRDAQQRVAVGWMPSGSNNCAAATTIITMNTGWRFYEDFVGQQLHATGLGTLLFMAVDANGNLDDDGEIDGFSRIWTQQKNSTGTSSQQFGAIATDDLFSSLRAYSIGLRQDTGFRTNVGIANLDTAEHTWDLQVYGSNSSTPVNFAMTVKPCALGQTNIPSGNYGPLLVSFVQREPSGLYWSAYGSSTDNITGDGWIVHATHGL